MMTLQKTLKILFITIFLLSISLFIFYLGEFLSIIKLIKYSLVANSFTLFFFILAIQIKEENKIMKYLNLIPLIVGTIIWNLGLFEFIEFLAIWQISFLLMIFGLVMTLFLKTTKNASVMMKFFTAFSTIMLLFVIYFTSQSLLDNSILLISSLVLFTLFSGISYFFSKK